MISIVFQREEGFANEPKGFVDEPKRYVDEPKRFVDEPKRFVHEPKRFVDEPKRFAAVPKSKVTASNVLEALTFRYVVASVAGENRSSLTTIFNIWFCFSEPKKNYDCFVALLGFFSRAPCTVSR